MITVVVAAPGEPARIQRIENELKPLQELVDGSIELVARYSSENGKELDIFCNDSGMLLQLQPNRVLETGQILVGTVVAVKADPETGEQISLTDFEAQAVVMQFNDSMVVPFAVVESA